MPNEIIINKLNDLKVDSNIKNNINALEGFITKNISTKLSNLLSPIQEQSKKLSEIIKPFSSLDKVFDTIASGMSKNNLVTEITKLREDIKKNYVHLKRNHDCFNDLDKAKKNLEEEMQKKFDDQNDSKIGEAENILKKYAILVLEEQIRKDKKLEAIIRFYNLNSPHPLCIARYIWLKKQSEEKKSPQIPNYAEFCEQLIRNKINDQVSVDKTGSSSPVEGDITLLDLARIKDWNAFTFNFGRQLRDLSSKKNETATLVTETPDALRETNSKLVDEVSQLKEKITFLEAQLSFATLNTSNDDVSASSTIETSNPSKDQYVERITDLNNELSKLTETNKTLTEEVETNKELNAKQQQVILNLNSDLENSKAELLVKETQVTENLEKLKQYEEQETLKKNELTSLTAENNQFSQKITDLSTQLEKKTQSLDLKIDEVNLLISERQQIEFQMQELEDKLRQTTDNSDGLLKLKEEEINRLYAQLENVNEELRTAQNNLSTNSKENDEKILILEADIKEKKDTLKRLNNELNTWKAKEKQFKDEATKLSNQLEKKVKQLDDNESQLKTLREQFENLSIQKEELEKKYQAQSTEYESFKEQHLQSIKGLEAKLASLQVENTLSDKEKLALKENIDSLESSLQKERTDLSVADQENLKLRTELSKLQAKFTLTDRELNYQLNLTKEEKESISKEFESITAEYASFISRVDEALPNFTPPDARVYFSLMASDASIKKPDEILQKIELLKKQAEQNKELQNQLDTLKAELEKKDAKIFNLDLSKIDFDDENTVKLTQEKEHLQERVTSLTKKIFKLEQQNTNFAQNSTPPTEFALDFEFEEDDFQSDPLTDAADFDSEDEIDDYQSFALTQKELVSTKSLLRNTQIELQQKLAEFSQLQAKLESQEKDSKNKIDNLKKSFEATQQELKKEIEALKKSSEETAGTLSALEKEKNEIKAELGVLNKTDLSSKKTISELKAQLAELTTLTSEKKDLIQSLKTKIEDQNQVIEKISTDAKYKIKKLEELNAQLTELNEKYSTTNNLKISELEKRIEDSVNFQREHEKLIQDLNALLNINKTDLEYLRENLKTADLQAQQHQESIEKLETEKLNLVEEISKLKQQNTELGKLPDQPAVNDELIVELEHGKKLLEEALMRANTDLKTVIEKHYSTQRSYSTLKDNYAKLEEELNDVKTKLEKYKKQLKETQEKGEKVMPNEDNLISFDDPLDINGDHIYSAVKFAHPDGSRSSVNSSGSSSPAPNSKNKDTSSPDEGISEGSKSSQGSLLSLRTQSAPNLSNPPASSFFDPIESTVKSPIVPITTSTNGGTPTMPTHEQQSSDALAKIKTEATTAFKRNSSAIIKAFAEEFLRIATQAAQALLNDNINAVLPDFKDKLSSIAETKVKKLITDITDDSNLLNPIINEIFPNGLVASTYLEQINNSALLIFNTLSSRSKQKYIDYISETGEGLLINICIEELKANEKDKLLEDAKTLLENKAPVNALEPIDHTEIILKAAEELVTKLLETNNLKYTLEEASKNPRLNLLDASKQKLQDQLEEQINQNFDHYFPNVHLDPILKKINNGNALSEEQLQKIPSELQYADTVEEFVTGLRIKYPNLASDYESKINDDTFKRLRLILRKKSLTTILLTAPEDHDIVNLSSETWLEKKLQLLTGTSSRLEKIQLDKDQKNLLNELDSALHLSTFYDIALTPKSITQLKAEIEKSNHAHLAAAEQANKLFSEIENQQKQYPSLIANDDSEMASAKYPNLIADDNVIAGFRGNLNQYLENLSLGKLIIADHEAKFLLMGINQRLKKDISRWSLLDNKLQKEITNEILRISDENSFKFSFDCIDANEKRKNIEELVTHALSVLRQNYSNDTFKKRELWIKNITLLHAAAKKLSAFNAKIANRKVKLENLSELKEKKDLEVQTTTKNPSTTFPGIFLPHNCTIIADTYNPNFEIPVSSEFKMLADTFYPSDAMKSGQTLTFEQKLSGGKSKEWSVTRDTTSYAYNTSSWVDKLKNVGGRIRNKIDPFTSPQLSDAAKEVTFAAFQHAVASNKGSVLTLSIGANCSKEKETYIRLLIQNFNQEQRKNGQKTTILIDNNDKLKVHKDVKAAMKDEIHTKNSPTKELDKAVLKSDEALNRYPTNSRGRG